MNALDLNVLLQSETEELLEKTKLLNTLSAVGQVELGGNYKYGTIADEDTNIAVIVGKKDIAYDLESKL